MKKIAVFLLIFALVLGFTGCGAKVESAQEEEKSMFVKLEDGPSWKILYHKESKVMYAVSWGSYTYGNFTLLVNADGTPMLWGGDAQDDQ